MCASQNRIECSGNSDVKDKIPKLQPFPSCYNYQSNKLFNGHLLFEGKMKTGRK
jgi:hypothetical protein